MAGNLGERPLSGADGPFCNGDLVVDNDVNGKQTCQVAEGGGDVEPPIVRLLTNEDGVTQLHQWMPETGEWVPAPGAPAGAATVIPTPDRPDPPLVGGYIMQWLSDYLQIPGELVKDYFDLPGSSIGNIYNHFGVLSPEERLEADLKVGGGGGGGGGAAPKPLLSIGPDGNEYLVQLGPDGIPVASHRLVEGEAPPERTLMQARDGTQYIVTVNPDGTFTSQVVDLPSDSLVEVTIPGINGQPDQIHNVLSDTAANINMDLFASGTVSASTQAMLDQDADFEKERQAFANLQLDEQGRANRASEALSLLNARISVRGQDIRARTDQDAQLLAIGGLAVDVAELNLQRDVQAYNAFLNERQVILRSAIPEDQIERLPDGSEVARFRFPQIASMLRRAGVSDFKDEDVRSFDLPVVRINPQEQAQGILDASAFESPIPALNVRAQETADLLSQMGVDFPNPSTLGAA